MGCTMAADLRGTRCEDMDVSCKCSVVRRQDIKVSPETHWNFGGGGKITSGISPAPKLVSQI
jgi:hypothetical protein